MAACSAEGRLDGRLYPRLQRPGPGDGKRKLLQKSTSLGRCTRTEAKARRDELAVLLRRTEFRLKRKNAEQDHSRWVPSAKLRRDKHARPSGGPL
jgi:hypothetical protein